MAPCHLCKQNLGQWRLTWNRLENSERETIYEQKFIKFLTSTEGDYTIEVWPEIVNEIIAAVRYVDIKWIKATVATEMDTCLANHIFPFICWVTTVQPNRKMRSTAIFWHYLFRDFSASITCKAIPSPWQVPITKRSFSNIPNSLCTTAGLVNCCIRGVAATVAALLGLGLANRST